MSSPLIHHPKAIIFDWEGTLVHKDLIIPGTTEFLEELAQLDYHLAVATGKSRLELDADIAALGWNGIFTVTRCAEECRSKPHPLMLIEILDVLGMMAHEAVMIGDTSYDLQMAGAIGMPALAVLGGLHSENELWVHQPLACLNNVTVLSEWLKELKKNI